MIINIHLVAQSLLNAKVCGSEVPFFIFFPTMFNNDIGLSTHCHFSMYTV